MAVNYSNALYALRKFFLEPAGLMNSKTSQLVLESAGLQIQSSSVSGAPGNSAVVLRFVAPVDMLFKAGLSNSAAVAGTAATAEAVFNIATDGGSAWGTITFAAAGTVGTFAAAADETVAAGSVVTVTGPASADATLADIDFSLVGYA